MIELAELESLRLQLVKRLPNHASWVVGEDLMDWDFSRARKTLRPIQSSDIVGGEILESWHSIYLFGDCAYADGGGAHPYVGINVQTGEVCGLDVERDDSEAVYLMNSSVARFIDTFLLVDSALAEEPQLLSGLSSRVRAIDPQAFPEGEWSKLADYVQATPSRA